LIVEENIGRFNIAMEYFVSMQISNPLQELFENALDLWNGKMVFHFEQSSKVVIHIFEN
jgi:hypothetical protein